ncbi:hypothetical protein [Cohnella fermenti]|uniref:Orc1-like AAA ATPase domain-containing protein n=1 Tax=Cohnella fermenti TaxID=2565925 RepID=A0A4S4C8Q0_9BACL|nr:hypothetical protein [Cohnella fermenti]THF83745.1 hypothetical protein E6C55_03390 [Cohnella fermenti]
MLKKQLRLPRGGLGLLLGALCGRSRTLHEQSHSFIGLYGATPILMTKIHIPGDTQEAVRRPRLIDRLNEGMRGKVSFVCAPAGFGKTTLLEHWASQSPIRPAWFSIDQGDNDLSRFWQYVVSSIDWLHLGFSERAGDVLKLIRPEQYELALTMLVNELHSPAEPIALVMDDFHTIADASLLASFVIFH